MMAQRGPWTANVALRCAVLTIAAIGVAGGCDHAPAATAGTGAFQPPPPHFFATRALAIAERVHTETASDVPRGQLFGPEPIAIMAVGDLYVGVLENASAIVAIDRDGTEVARAKTPPHPRAVTQTAAGEILVAAGSTIARYMLRTEDHATTLARNGGVTVTGTTNLRALAASDDHRHPRTVYAVDENTGKLLAVTLPNLAETRTRPTEPRALGQCKGPTDIATMDAFVVLGCFVDNAVVGWRIAKNGSAREVFRIEHGAPLWSIALARKESVGYLLAVTGVEKPPGAKPQDTFDHLDSFLFLYAVASSGTVENLAAINVSALGVVTPRWIHMTQSASGALEITTSGYGAEKLATLRWSRGKLQAAPTATTRKTVPGIASAALRAPGFLAADPLLDGWVITEPESEPTVIPIAEQASPRGTAYRVGEAIFSTIMAIPNSDSQGQRSRFSCAGCHFDGYVGGRAHGPHNASPAHFVSGLLSRVNQPTDTNPWFPVDTRDAPWLSHLGDVPERLSPVAIRFALMTFLANDSP